METFEAASVRRPLQQRQPATPHRQMESLDAIDADRGM